MSKKASLTLYVLKSKWHNEVATSYISTSVLQPKHNSTTPPPPCLAIADASIDLDKLAPSKESLLVTVTFSNA
jgi:hypothetical protein